MKRFSFRLTRVLELRAFKEREAEIELAAKAGRCALIERSLEENAQAAARAAKERFRPGATIDESRYAEFYISRLSVERKRLAKELAAAEIERERARVAYVERRKERSAIDKLKERALADWKKEAEREEVRELDDVAQSARLRNPAFEEVLEL
jgi:flagellar FliJ protein